MLRYFKLVVITAGFLCFSPADAQNDFYVFAALGNTDAGVGLGGLNRVDGDDSGYMFGAGYAFTGNFALEGSYQDFGSLDGQTDCPPGFACLVIPLRTKTDVAAFSLSAIWSYPLNERLDVYGKLGVTSWDIEFEGISAAFDDSGEDLHYGVGLRWAMSDRWKVFADYSRVDLDLDVINLGIRHEF